MSKDYRAISVFVAVVGFISMVVGNATAQYRDPYADQEAAANKKLYAERRVAYLRLVKNLYFAVGCRVFASEASILSLLNNETRRYFIGFETVIDHPMTGDRQRAAREGLAQANEPSACDYYRLNPDVLANLRRAAEQAR